MGIPTDAITSLSKFYSLVQGDMQALNEGHKIFALKSNTPEGKKMLDSLDVILKEVSSSGSFDGVSWIQLQALLVFRLWKTLYEFGAKHNDYYSSGLETFEVQVETLMEFIVLFDR